jgi:hypothetical protein
MASRASDRAGSRINPTELFSMPAPPRRPRMRSCPKGWLGWKANPDAGRRQARQGNGSALAALACLDGPTVVAMVVLLSAGRAGASCDVPTWPQASSFFVRARPLTLVGDGVYQPPHGASQVASSLLENFQARFSGLKSPVELNICALSATHGPLARSLVPRKADYGAWQQDVRSALYEDAAHGLIGRVSRRLRSPVARTGLAGCPAL